MGTPQANVTATLTLSDANAGALSTGTSNAVTSTYNAVTGVWQASGARADVNILLASTALTPATDYDQDFTITTQVQDGIDTLNGSITMSATGVNDAPTVDNALLDQFINQSGALSYTFAANSFGDVDTGDSLTYTAQLDGGGALPGWIVFDDTTRNFNVTAGAAVVGDYDIRVTATDTGAQSVSDVFTFAVAPDAMYGTVNQDYIQADNADQLIIALDGDDYVYAEGGNDTVYGNEGNDRLYGETGGGETGSDLIYGGDGHDNLYLDYQHSPGDNRDDTGYGGAGNDNLYGYGGDDLLDGGDDNDRLYGGLGDDSLVGGAGDDDFYGEEGADTLTGGDGDDDFWYTNPVVHSSAASYDVIEDFTQGEDKIWVVGYTAIAAGAPSGTALGYTFDGTHTVVTSADGFELRLTGNLTLTAADFQFLSIIGTNGNDTLNGTNGIDGIIALDGDDVIKSGAGNDLVWGGDGNDTIDPGESADTIYGGSGNDVYIAHLDTTSWVHLYSGRGGLSIKDFVHGEDKIDISGLPIKSFVTSGGDTTTIRATYDAGTDITTLHWGGLGDYYGSSLTWYLDGNVGLDAGDFIFGTVLEDATGNEVINGTAGDDNIIASFGGDTINAGDGVDKINVLSSNNWIDSGDGDNIIWMRGSGDTIFGGTGNDIVYDYNAGGSLTYAFLGDGIDFTRYLYGHVFLEDGNDQIYFQGGGSQSTVYAGNDNDWLYQVSSSALDVYGERGNDLIYMSQSSNNSSAYGGEGDDNMYAVTGASNVLVHGGYGADRFNVYNHTTQTSVEVTYYDPNESTSTETDYFYKDANVYWFDAGAEATADKIIMYGFTGIAEGAASGTTLGYSYDGTYTVITSSADYSFEVRVQGDYTTADSDGDGEVFDDTNNFEFQAGILQTMGDDNYTDTPGNSSHILGLEGNDTINAGNGSDTVYGGHGNDDINGVGGHDQLYGGYGNDTIEAGAENDTMEGGSGNDVFVFSDLTHSTNDIITDFKHGGDADKIDLTGLGITGIGAGASEITIQYNGDQYTSISHNSSTFEIFLLGYYEVGVDISAADFIF